MTPARTGPPPLSPGQQRMWFLAKLQPQSSALNLGMALDLTGPLDVDLLDAAVRDVAGRFPVLTTTYPPDTDGEPRPGPHAVVPGLVNRWRVKEPVGMPPAGSEQVQVLVRREFGHVFALEEEPPVRVSVLRIDAERHVLVVVAHHIAWDDGCWDVYFGELTDAYRRAAKVAAGGGFAVPGAVPVADGTGASAPAPKEKDYWAAVLADPPDPVEFPGEPAGLRAPRTDSAVTETVLPAARTAALDRVARRAGADLASVLLACFQIVVARSCRVTDMLIAAPLANRDTHDARRALGCVATTVVVRGRVDDQEHLGDMVSRVAADLREARRHGRAALDPLRHVTAAQGHDAVRLRFGECRPPAALFAPSGVSATVAASRTGHTDLPLSLGYEIRDTTAGRECVLRFEYQVDVIAARVAEAIVEQTVCVLAGATDDALPRPTGDLRVLSDKARDRVLALSRGARDHTPPTTLPELFAHQVRARPLAHAVMTDDRAVTYGELDALSDAAADRLAAQGVRTGSLVGCVLPPSVDLVVTALAVVKLGAVYLPVDPGQPEDHIAHVLGGAGATGVIGLRPGLVPGAARLVLPAVADGAGPPPRRRGGRPGPRPAHPAYAIYTSASTGRPKGVLVTHRAITEYLGWILRHSGIGAGDSVLQVASPGFDASIGEIFGCLASGARLVIPREGGLADVEYLTGLLREHGITSMHLVPSQMAAFLALPAVERWTSLHWVPVGGEALAGALADRFNATFDARLSHFYGPAEATLSVSRYEVTVPQGQRTVPVGTPKDNTEIYLLDDRLRLVDIGVVGEIYVGGSQLALGYLGQHGQTAARFVADPFCPGGRLYRTGDLGRWSPDGALDFLGRADRQVRLGGSRIEFGEIESVVARAANLTQCVVTLDDHPTRGKRLIAYVVLPDGGPVPPGAEHRIQRAVAATLPGHLVPERVVGIGAVPLTRDGKLDRDALPVLPDRPGTGARTPTAATETRLCAVFADLTGAAEVTADDSFFDLGGHALLAARLVSRVRADFGVDLPVGAVFECPTPAALAERVDLAVVEMPARVRAARTGAGPAPGDFPLAPVPELSAAQAGILDRFAGGGPGPTDNVVFGVQIRGPVSHAALQGALGDLLARHEILRTRFGRDADGVTKPRVHPATAGVVMTVTTAAAGDDVAAMWSAAARRIDISRELPVHADLVVHSPQKALLLLVVHHIAADRWSMPVLAADLATAYRARALGAAPRWPPHPVRHSEFATWQRSLAAEEHAARWARELQAPVGPAPDADRSRAPTIDHLRLPPDRRLRSAVERLAALAGADERSVLLGAVGRLLGERGPGETLVLWTPAPEGVPATVDATPGPLVHLLPVRVDPREAAADPVRAVRGIGERVVRGVSHLGLPVPGPANRVVVAFGRPESPIVEVGAPDAGVTTMVPLAPVHPAATTDLTVEAWPDPAGIGIDIAFRADRRRRDSVVTLGRRLADVCAAMAASGERSPSPGRGPADPRARKEQHHR